MVACNQQSQSTIEQEVTQEVKPVPAKPDKKKRSRSRKPAPAPREIKEKQEAVAPVTVAPVEAAPETGQATITAAAPEIAKPVRLKPLGKRVSQVPVKGKYVALTFDDGPHASFTPQALAILNRHGAKGTFFMLGQNAARNRSLVARVAAEGHEVGVHTWSHIKMNSNPRARVDSEISRTQNLLGNITGVYPRVMRPPYGATSKALVEHMYKRYGMASIMWDVDTLDWRKPGVGKVVSTAVNKAKPGSIILVHDIHGSTLSALEGIVTGLQARGFQLVTVSELMQIRNREEAEAAAAAAAAAAAPAVTTDSVQEPAPAESVEPMPLPVVEPVEATGVQTMEIPQSPEPVSQPQPVVQPEPAPAEQPALTPENFIIY